VEWTQVEAGVLTGIADRQHGSAWFGDAASWDAFRAGHRKASGSKRETKSEPLRDLDFATHDYVVVWGGTMYRTLEVEAAGDGLVVRESRPEWEERAARIVGAGTYRLLALPKTGLPVAIQWSVP